MIVSLLFMPLVQLIKTLINILPNAFNLPDWSFQALSLITKGLMFFPVDVWIFVIGNIMFWLYVQFIWACVEWVYKKIPGVD